MPKPPTQSITARLAAGVWYAEGAARELAAELLLDQTHLDELVECLFSPDVGTKKRTAMALEIISKQRPALLQPYKDILLIALEEEFYWHVLFRLCTIVPRLALRTHERERVLARLQVLIDSPQNALGVNALSGFVTLAKSDETLREMALWLVETKARTGSKAMQARCRQLLRILMRTQPAND